MYLLRRHFPGKCPPAAAGRCGYVRPRPARVHAPPLAAVRLQKAPVAPVFADTAMRKVAAQAEQKANAGRLAQEKAAALLARAKRAVEIAIEKDEAAALEFIGAG